MSLIQSVIHIRISTKKTKEIGKFVDNQFAD